MKFKEATDKIEGMRFLLERMDILSPVGRILLLDSPLEIELPTLESELDNLEKAVAVAYNPEETKNMEQIRLLLMQTRDIRTTLSRLADGAIPDDIEMFEIKGLALTCAEVGDIIRQSQLSAIPSVALPRLDEVCTLLDPQATKSRNFYIYDLYSDELATVRRQLRALQAQQDYDESLSERLTAECIKIEENVRTLLAEKLRPFAGELSAALHTLGRLDILLAKAALTKEYQLVRPSFNLIHTSYTSLRFLPSEEMLKSKGRKFQPVDIDLRRGVTLITGTNMGGKTITLKSLAMAQAMAQFGFFVSAASADICPVSDIVAIGEDSQSTKSALSSFGSEILKLDDIVSKADSEKMLILIDEPARTTNPEEGRAIVSALTAMLNDTRSISVVTTHYSGVDTECCRLRVKGLGERADDMTALSAGMLSDLMDYTLEQDDDPEVPHEALRIARLLGISPQFASRIEDNLKN